MESSADSAPQSKGDIPQGMDLADPALEQVRRDLAEGESILWAYCSEELPEFEGCSLRVGLPIALGAWLIVALCVCLFQFPRFNALGYFIGVLMVCAAIAGILIPLVILGATLEYVYQRRKPRRQLKVLTNRRAILLEPVDGNPRKAVHVISLYPKMLWMIAREEEPDGRGNIVFETIGSQGERSFPLKFENVPDVRRVEAFARYILLPVHTTPVPAPAPLAEERP